MGMGVDHGSGVVQECSWWLGVVGGCKVSDRGVDVRGQRSERVRGTRFLSWAGVVGEVDDWLGRNGRGCAEGMVFG